MEKISRLNSQSKNAVYAHSKQLQFIFGDYNRYNAQAAAGEEKDKKNQSQKDKMGKDLVSHSARAPIHSSGITNNP